MASAPPPATLIIRLPPNLKQRILEEAVATHSSMNTVVVETLAERFGIEAITPRYSWPSNARTRHRETLARKATRAGA